MLENERGVLGAGDMKAVENLRGIPLTEMHLFQHLHQCDFWCIYDVRSEGGLFAYTLPEGVMGSWKGGAAVSFNGVTFQWPFSEKYFKNERERRCVCCYRDCDKPSGDSSELKAARTSSGGGWSSVMNKPEKPGQHTGRPALSSCFDVESGLTFIQPHSPGVTNSLHTKSNLRQP